MSNRAQPLLLIVVALALVAGACSNGDTARTDVTTSATTVAPSTQTTTPPSTSTRTSETPPTPSETVASTYFIATADLPVIAFERGGSEVASLPVEVVPLGEFPIGLSGRATLEGRGMVFYFDGTGSSFWMKNTHIDLDIAFVLDDGEIIDIQEMQAESEATHHPGQDYRYAIEAPVGWYASNGVEIGDTAVPDVDLRAARDG